MRLFGLLVFVCLFPMGLIADYESDADTSTNTLAALLRQAEEILPESTVREFIPSYVSDYSDESNVSSVGSIIGREIVIPDIIDDILALQDMVNKNPVYSPNFLKTLSQKVSALGFSFFMAKEFLVDVYEDFFKKKPFNPENKTRVFKWLDDYKALSSDTTSLVFKNMNNLSYAMITASLNYSLEPLIAADADYKDLKNISMLVPDLHGSSFVSWKIVGTAPNITRVIDLAKAMIAGDYTFSVDVKKILLDLGISNSESAQRALYAPYAQIPYIDLNDWEKKYALFLWKNPKSQLEDLKTYKTQIPSLQKNYAQALGVASYKTAFQILKMMRDVAFCLGSMYDRVEHVKNTPDSSLSDAVSIYKISKDFELNADNLPDLEAQADVDPTIFKTLLPTTKVTQFASEEELSKNLGHVSDKNFISPEHALISSFDVTKLRQSPSSSALTINRDMLTSVIERAQVGGDTLLSDMLANTQGGFVEENAENLDQAFEGTIEDLRDGLISAGQANVAMINEMLNKASSDLDVLLSAALNPVLHAISDTKKLCEDILHLPALANIAPKPVINWGEIVSNDLPSPADSGVTASTVFDGAALLLKLNQNVNEIVHVNSPLGPLVFTLTPEIVSRFSVLQFLVDQYKNLRSTLDIASSLDRSSEVLARYQNASNLFNNFSQVIEVFNVARSLLINAINSSAGSKDTFEVVTPVTNSQKIEKEISSNTYDVWMPIEQSGNKIVLSFKALSPQNDVYVAFRYGLNKYMQLTIGGWGNTQTCLNNIVNGTVLDETSVALSKPVPTSTDYVLYVISIVTSEDGSDFASLNVTANGREIFSYTDKVLNQKYSDYGFCAYLQSSWKLLDDSVVVSSELLSGRTLMTVRTSAHLQMMLDATKILSSMLAESIDVFFQAVSDAKRLCDDVAECVDPRTHFSWSDGLPKGLPAPHASGVSVFNVSKTMINEPINKIVNVNSEKSPLILKITPEMTSVYNKLKDLYFNFRHSKFSGSEDMNDATSKAWYSVYRYQNASKCIDDFDALKNSFNTMRININTLPRPVLTPISLKTIDDAINSLNSAMKTSVDGFLQAISNAKNTFDAFAGSSKPPFALDWGTSLPDNLPESDGVDIEALDKISEATINDIVNNINDVNLPGHLVFNITSDAVLAYNNLKSLLERVSGDSSSLIKDAKSLLDFSNIMAQAVQVIDKYENVRECIKNLKDVIDTFNKIRLVVIPLVKNNTSSKSTNEKIKGFFGNIGDGFKTMGSGIGTGFKKFGGLFH